MTLKNSKTAYSGALVAELRTESQLTVVHSKRPEANIRVYPPPTRGTFKRCELRPQGPQLHIQSGSFPCPVLPLSYAGPQLRATDLPCRDKYVSKISCAGFIYHNNCCLAGCCCISYCIKLYRRESVWMRRERWVSEFY